MARPHPPEYFFNDRWPEPSGGRIRIDTQDTGSKKFAIGVAVTHVYGIEVLADTHDAALLKMDSWLRGDLPANAMTAKIRSSDLRVVGMGAVAYGRVSEVGELSEATRTEMATRGRLPETAWLDVLPPPPRGVAQDGET